MKPMNKKFQNVDLSDNLQVYKNWWATETLEPWLKKQLGGAMIIFCQVSAFLTLESFTLSRAS